MAMQADGARIPTRAWRMLVLGMLAQAAGTLLVSTPAYLIPLLHVQQGISLSRAGLLASAPTFGMVLTLVLWGHLADRHGERWVIAGGLGLAAVFALVALPVKGFVGLGLLLVLGGAATASANAASGRIVMGWFPAARRGLAMGVRQMSQPIGVALAAVTVPHLASRFGTRGPMLVDGVVLAIVAVACAAWLVNPARAASSAGNEAVGANPYRGSGFLWRIHAESILLVIPQYTLSTFSLVWLITQQGWQQTTAGLVIGVAQLVGAGGRAVVGGVSDRVGSRTRVLRWVAVSGVVVMLALAGVGWAHWSGVSAVVLIVATMCSVASNGLAFTSVAEASGNAWSGKALGIQNTGQFIGASAVGPCIGALIAVVGYPAAFALVAIAPLLAIPVIPPHDEHRD
jgi:MFS family permease